MISNHPNLKEDDLVTGFIGWEEYSVIPKGSGLQKIQYMDLPLSSYLGVLGNVIFFLNICFVKK